MKKRCSACGRTIRTGKLIYVASSEGIGLARKRVGPCCAWRAVSVLVASVDGARCSCGKPATTCVGCVADDERKDVQGLVKKAVHHLRQLARAYPPDSERAEGMQQAADILEAGGF